MTITPTPAAVEKVARAIWQAPLTGQPVGKEVRSWPPRHSDALIEVTSQARAAIAAMQPAADGWRPIAEAPRDGTRILAVYRQPGDERHWNGRIFEVWHEGVTVSGYDMGWALFPGHGGVPGDWLAGWMPKPSPPVEQPS